MTDNVLEICEDIQHKDKLSNDNIDSSCDVECPICYDKIDLRSSSNEITDDKFSSVFSS